MGKQSFDASTALESFEMRRYSTMHEAMFAVLYLRDGNSNQYALFKEDYADRSGAHVEDSLIECLKTHYQGNLAGVPNRSRLVFFGNYSPCQHCTSETIPAFMNALGAVGRAIQVKFLFFKYYSVEDHGSSSSGLLYKTNKDAADAYAALMAQYRPQSGGIVYLQKTRESFQNTYQTSPPTFTRSTEYKEIRPLVIAQKAASKALRYTATSTVTDLSGLPQFASITV